MNQAQKLALYMVLGPLLVFGAIKATFSPVEHPRLPLTNEEDWPAYGHIRPAPATAPWPVLDDGRVVFTVYGVKIAMPTCPVCLDYSFYGEKMDSRFGRTNTVKVRDAIAYPARLKFLEANTSGVRLQMYNDWRPEANRGPFLGRFDPLSLPSIGMDLRLRRVGVAPCWEGPRSADCLGIHELDVNGRRADQVMAGMNVFKNLPARDYSQPGYVGSFVLFGTFYLAPAEHPRDAVGLPVRFSCDSLGICHNSETSVGDGFALRPNIKLNFSFQESKYAPNEWVALHDRLVDAVGTLLVE